MSRLKKFLVIGGIAATATFGFAFRDNYFEISKNIDIFTSVYKEVNTYYVDEVEASRLMRTGIDAMLNSLDPYTNFISESEIEDYRIQITGQYGGVGASIIRKGEYILISDPYEGYPAQLNDLRAGDILLEADGKTLKGKSSDEVSKLLKGQAGSEVKLLLKRDETTFEKVVKRADIKIKNVPYFGMVNESTGYIVLSEFRSDAGKEVADALMALKKNPNLKSVILDLRNNPGGLLHEAVNVVNVFVPRNQLVVSTKGKVKEMDHDYKTLNNPVDAEIPLVVLVNKNAASASEIVSGTIQDLDRGVVVGQKSFGKGLVQSTRPLSFGTQVKITTQKYYIPSGRCIQAIDYSKKDEHGKGTKIADSLHKSFKTRNGRKVNDGGGVDPDVKTDKKELSEISKALLTNFLIFDYATRYRNTHASIADIKQFKLTESEWNEFVKFVREKGVEYKTGTEKMLDDLKKKAEEEKYYSYISNQYEQLKKQVDATKDQDLINNRQEITRQLEKEILTRYYFQKAEFERQFDHDVDLIGAIGVLKDIDRYQSILK